jgi:dolichol-phosphate mannosyltransferase
MAPTLSIVVPTFKCPTIDRDLRSLDDFLSKNKTSYEIICVVDGLKDSHDQTLKKAQRIKRKNVKVFFYPQNHGKGYAVRYGFQKAKGKIIGFFDAGSDINVANIKTALNLIQNKKVNPDIVIASKRHPQSRINRYPPNRHFLSSFSQLMTKAIFNFSVSDTQVGLKLFKRSVIRKVLPLLSINSFAFDIELLALSNRLGFQKVLESPVDVTYNDQSTIRLSSLLNFALDYFRIARKVRHSFR